MELHAKTTGYCYFPKCSPGETSLLNENLTRKKCGIIPEYEYMSFELWVRYFIEFLIRWIGISIILKVDNKKF